jgi:peptidoglycan/LPS O-acetylase OafA/YrhL
MRVRILDPLRGFAALAVVLFHYSGSVLPTIAPNALTDALKVGKLGVQVFFVISGFVIPYALARAGYQWRQVPRFLCSRFARIAPPAYAAALLMVIFYFASVLWNGRPPHMAWPGFGAQAILGNLLFVSQYMGSGYYNFVYWTLEIEFQYYLVIALLMPMLMQPSRSALAGGLLFFLMGLSYLPGFSFFNYTHQFVPGIAAFLFIEKVFGRVWFWSVCIGAFCMGSFKDQVVEMCVAMATVLAIIHARGFTWAPATWLGTISYSLYIMHVPVAAWAESVVKRVLHFSDTAVAKVLLLFMYLCLCIAAAALFHRFVEGPALRWSKRISGRRAGAWWRPKGPPDQA